LLDLLKSILKFPDKAFSCPFRLLLYSNILKETIDPVIFRITLPYGPDVPDIAFGSNYLKLKIKRLGFFDNTPYSLRYYWP
jgi:hypothetical protein